jgi:putative PEP-CTERM system histidine kinase
VNLAAYSHAAAALAYGAFALYLIRADAARRPLAAHRWAMLSAVIASALWGAAGLAAQTGGGATAAIAAGVLDLSRYAAWFVFAMLLLRLHAGQRHMSRTVWRTIGFGALAVVAAAVYLASSAGSGADALARNLPLVSLALPVIGLVLVEQLFRRTEPDSRWHIKPLCLGLASIFLYDVYVHSHVLLFGRFDPDAVLIRSVAHALPVVLLYVASQRQANSTGAIQLSRSTVFHTATLMLVGVYLLVLSAMGYYVRHLGGDWGGALQVVLVCVGLIALATLTFSGAMRAKLRVLVGKSFFRYRYDYRTEWLRFTARLTAARSPQEIGTQVARGLAEMLNSPAASLWACEAGARRFTQSARWNAARSSCSEPADSLFAQFIGQREWIVDLDEHRAHPHREPDPAVPDWLLERKESWLLVPLVVADELTGFVVIDRPHADVRVNWEIRDLLKTAGRQAAGFLALMHATDALLEARKFEAFNRMSAFVVHDLKNIVAQLSLMMQNARRLKDNAEFQEDMLATVDNSLERMRRLMLQLRSGETPMQAAAGVALTPVVERIAAAARARGRKLTLRLAESPVTRGHEDRIERVLGHFVDNALDATQEGGDVSLSLEREGGQARIVVRDTGTGMSAQFVNERLFRPFNSTKSNGMGIGSYESSQYIREIGGGLNVDSEPGRGTVITVLLPLLDVGLPQRSDLYSSAK